MSVLTLEAKLERAETNTPWGFRMQGGKDFSSPLTIQRVNPGSLAAKCGLQVGDIILKIGNLGADTLRHKEAQDTIVASGNRLDLLLQRGGGAPSYDTFSAPQTNSFTPTPKAPLKTSSQPNANFNSSAKPFGYGGGSGVDNITNRTNNLSMEPDYSAAAQKYSDYNEPPASTQPQSSSFRFLQNMVDNQQDVPSSAFKPSPAGPPPPPPSNPQTYIAQPVGPGDTPGTVKAIVSQRYNTPIGLYSDTNVQTTFKGQSRYLVSPEEGEELAKQEPKQNGTSSEPKKYQPSETYKLIHEAEEPKSNQPTHSRSFKFLQQQLGENKGPASAPAPYNPVPYTPPASKAPTWKPQAAPVAAAPKTWTPSAAPPPALAPRLPPAKPSGTGALRGKRGDASMQNQASVGGIPKVATCASCGNTIRGPFVLAMGKSWCPEHFVCANPRCGRKLIDVGFVEEGGFLYCEQDYAQHFAPKCNRCNQAIVGECVNAIQKQWHPECFLCSKCNQPIGGTQFHIEEGKPYCERDWGAMFQTMCAGCEFPIEPGDRWVEAMGQNFHSECFYCMTCQVSLEGQPFYCKGGKPFCKKHAR